MLASVRADARRRRGPAPASRNGRTSGPVDEGVAGDADEPDDQRPAPAAPAPRRTSAARDSRGTAASPIAACGGSGRPGAQAPAPGPSPAGSPRRARAPARSGWRSTIAGPQALADGAAHVAHGWRRRPSSRRDHRRGGDHQADAEDQEGDEKVRAERAAASVRRRPGPSSSRRSPDQRLAEIGQDQRPGERQRRANLVAPRGGGNVGPTMHRAALGAVRLGLKRLSAAHLPSPAGRGWGRRLGRPEKFGSRHPYSPYPLKGPVSRMEAIWPRSGRAGMGAGAPSPPAPISRP